MRAGLLSQPKVIQRINQHFVSATISRFELEKLAQSGDGVAQVVLDHFQTPLVLVFLSPEGNFVTKLSSLKELNEVHPDTSRRPEALQHPNVNSDANNARVFLEHLNRHFPNQTKP